MAVNLAGDGLPCGHDIDQLWNHLVRDAPDEHARSCEHCQTALTEIRPLRTAISMLAAEQVFRALAISSPASRLLTGRRISSSETS